MHTVVVAGGKGVLYPLGGPRAPRKLGWGMRRSLIPREVNQAPKARAGQCLVVIPQTNIPLKTFVLDVRLQVAARKLLGAMGAFGRELRYGLLYRQVANAATAADFTAAVRTRWRLILQPCIGQQVRQATGARQMAISALKFHNIFINMDHTRANWLSKPLPIDYSNTLQRTVLFVQQ